MSKIFKTLLYLFGVLIGASAIFLSILATSITKGIDVTSIDEVMSYLSGVGGEILIPADISLTLIFIEISKYSYLIFTASAIWLIIITYIWWNYK